MRSQRPLISQYPLPLSVTHLPYATLFRSRSNLKLHCDLPASRPRLGLACNLPPQRANGGPMLNTIWGRSEEHTSELQSRLQLVCRLLLQKKKAKALAKSHIRRRMDASAAA